MLETTPLVGVCLDRVSDRHYDDRGSFREVSRLADIDIGYTPHFMQENELFSYRGVIRGMHFHTGMAQIKYVEVLNGEIIDVAVNVIKSHEEYGRYYACRLTPYNYRMLIGPGYAHGFLALKDSIVRYKSTTYHDPANEERFAWNDPKVGIAWGDWSADCLPHILSEEDRNARWLDEVAIP